MVERGGADLGAAGMSVYGAKGMCRNCGLEIQVTGPDQREASHTLSDSFTDHLLRCVQKPQQQYIVCEECSETFLRVDAIKHFRAHDEDHRHETAKGRQG